MSALILVIVFALIQNIDNAMLAIAYRLRNVIIPLRSNLTVAALSGFATGAGVILAGASRFEAANVDLGSFSELVGRGILVMIGIWTLVGYFRSKLFPYLNEALFRDNELNGGHNGSTSGDKIIMGVSAAMIPGTALAADNIAPSFAFGLVNSGQGSIIIAGFILAALTAAFSVVSIWIGQAAGVRGKNHLHWTSPKMVSGCLMIAIGLLEPRDFVEAWIKLNFIPT
jgi:putative Mn2+ efflux pump MntP